MIIITTLLWYPISLQHCDENQLIWCSSTPSPNEVLPARLLHPIHKHGGARSLHQHEENLWYLTALTRVPVCFARSMKPCFSGHLLDVTVVSCSCSRVNYWLPDIPCLVAVAMWISRPIDCLILLLCLQWLRVYLRSGKLLCVWTQKYCTRCEVGISHACGLKLAPNRRIV